jgi:hypothetical protein
LPRAASGREFCLLGVVFGRPWSPLCRRQELLHHHRPTAGQGHRLRRGRMKSRLPTVFQHQHYSIEVALGSQHDAQDLLGCPDLPALLDWGELRSGRTARMSGYTNRSHYRHLRQSYEYEVPQKEKKEEDAGEDTKQQKSTWSNLYGKVRLLFPYLWPRDQPWLQLRVLLCVVLVLSLRCTQPPQPPQPTPPPQPPPSLPLPPPPGG